MLVLTKKQYEIEEPIILNDENGNEIYKFDMKITPEEKLKIRDLIFSDSDVKNGRLLKKLEKEGKNEEYIKLEAKVLEEAKERQEMFEKICFKEHKEPFKNVAGAKYEEMIEMLFDFFVKTFADKKLEQINSMTTHLKKITNK